MKRNYYTLTQFDSHEVRADHRSMAFYPDEKDRPRRKGFIASWEYALGAFTVIVGLAGFVAAFNTVAGWFQ